MGKPWNEEYEEAWAAGFLDAMRCTHPSETVGLLIVDYDIEIEGGES